MRPKNRPGKSKRQGKASSKARNRSPKKRAIPVPERKLLKIKIVEGLPKKIAKGYRLKKVRSQNIYLVEHIKTGKVKQSEIAGVKIPVLYKKTKNNVWEEYQKKYPTFHIFTKGHKKSVQSRQSRFRVEERKAQKKGRGRGIEHAAIVRPEDFKDQPPKTVISQSVIYKEGKKTVEKKFSPKMNLKGKAVKMVFNYADGTRQESSNFKKRSKNEVELFKASSRMASSLGVKPHEKIIGAGQVNCGFGSGIGTTRNLVSKMLGSIKIPSGRKIKAAFDWHVLESLLPGSKELAGKNQSHFIFDTAKATKAFTGFYRRIVKEKLQEYFDMDSPEEVEGMDESDRRSAIKELKKQGLIPLSPLAYFIESQILKIAKDRGIVISGGGYFKDFHKTGYKSAQDEEFQSQMAFSFSKL